MGSVKCWPFLQSLLCFIIKKWRRRNEQQDFWWQLLFFKFLHAISCWKSKAHELCTSCALLGVSWCSGTGITGHSVTGIDFWLTIIDIYVYIYKILLCTPPISSTRWLPVLDCLWSFIHGSGYRYRWYFLRTISSAINIYLIKTIKY